MRRAPARRTPAAAGPRPWREALPASGWPSAGHRGAIRVAFVPAKLPHPPLEMPDDRRAILTRAPTVQANDGPAALGTADVGHQPQQSLHVDRAVGVGPHPRGCPE